MELIDIELLKEKFSTFIALIYDQCGIELSNITETIIKNEYFDFLEKNEANEFINSYYEEIYEEIYKSRVYFNYSLPIISEIYWAAMQYINISINCNIPLRTVALLISMTELVDYYPIYHELNDLQFIENFKNNEYKRSIFKRLNNDYSKKELSYITGIPVVTLNMLENNDSLFKASRIITEKIIYALNVSNVFFKNESSFIPYDAFLFQYDDFVYKLTDELINITNINGDYALFFINDDNYEAQDNSLLVFSPYISIDESKIRKLLAKHRGIYNLSIGCVFYKYVNNSLQSYDLSIKYKTLVKKIINELINESKELLF